MPVASSSSSARLQDDVLLRGVGEDQRQLRLVGLPRPRERSGGRAVLSLCKHWGGGAAAPQRAWSVRFLRKATKQHHKATAQAARLVVQHGVDQLEHGRDARSSRNKAHLLLATRRVGPLADRALDVQGVARLQSAKVLRARKAQGRRGRYGLGRGRSASGQAGGPQGACFVPAPLLSQPHLLARRACRKSKNRADSSSVTLLMTPLS